ncbi:divalent-cation tolerance protein CutA [Beijerinckia indica]|uniref:CutA1 divalent ion tolerance protein n=1 Tax=Beijerinckia indica subsp. indica (strain ATCC 9039 / DSM 1715 / NCIMB 8712) TaxID=395963 RepID=B2IGL7_BEII9|nr:divalent-cation tolerance protein CutA [Beijerinckia indica]ACB95778.1 CutA1 divalent ion tolerance protein [Beijerinckia indica subsp. indica ATCC 9039]
MSTDAAFALVMTTCGGAENARRIAQALVEDRLAACVQILPIESFYRWEDAVQNDQELLLFCKIKRDDYADVEAAILSLHEYVTPEIVEIDISQGAPAYLAWITSATR